MKNNEQKKIFHSFFTSIVFSLVSFPAKTLHSIHQFKMWSAGNTFWVYLYFLNLTDMCVCVDCSEVFADGNAASGLYVIRPDGFPRALSVYCDMNNGGGWTVFQRRRDGKENFDRCVHDFAHTEIFLTPSIEVVISKWYFKSERGWSTSMALGTCILRMANSGWAMMLYIIALHKVCCSIGWFVTRRKLANKSSSRSVWPAHRDGRLWWERKLCRVQEL